MTVAEFSSKAISDRQIKLIMCATKLILVDNLTVIITTPAS